MRQGGPNRLQRMFVACDSVYFRLKAVPSALKGNEAGFVSRLRQAEIQRLQFRGEQDSPAPAESMTSPAFVVKPGSVSSITDDDQNQVYFLGEPEVWPCLSTGVLPCL